MKKKILLLICLIAIAMLSLTACTSTPTDDTEERAAGYRIVLHYDGGRYLKTEQSDVLPVQPVIYGEAESQEEVDLYNSATSTKRQIRMHYYLEDSYARDPQTDTDIMYSLEEREFIEWRIASVVAFKQMVKEGVKTELPISQLEPSQLQFSRNKENHCVYDYVIPQQDDIVWDYQTFKVGTYQDHPYAKVKTLHDYTKGVNELVEINGTMVPNLYELTDTDLNYNEETGYNIYLYAVWRARPYFVLKCADPDTGDIVEIGRQRATDVKPNFSLTYANDLYNSISSTNDLRGNTLYKLYADVDCTVPWDETAVYSSFNMPEDIPFKILYAKMLKGNWTICTTSQSFKMAVNNNSSNIYLDNDIEFEGNNTWFYTLFFNYEINGNGHTVTFQNSFTINTDWTKNNPNKAIQESGPVNYGLIGYLNGKIYDINFQNVTYTAAVPTSRAISENGVALGVLIGRMGAGASVNNVTVTGKIIFEEIADGDATAPWNVVYARDHADKFIYTSNWLGSNDTGTQLPTNAVNFTLI